jgi:type VI secretion system protein ImpF
MKAGDKNNRFVPPLMFAFREAFRQRDADDVIEDRNQAGERVLAARRVSPRSMTSEAALKTDLAEDLTSLFNTVNLEATEDLQGLDHVRQSILNFGLGDLTTITADSAKVFGLGEQLKNAVQHFENRLVDGSVQVIKEQSPELMSATGNIRMHLKADMHAAPADVSVEFMTDIEAGSGRSHVSKT